MMIANMKDENMKEEHASIFQLHVIEVKPNNQRTLIVSISEQKKAKPSLSQAH